MMSADATYSASPSTSSDSLSKSVEVEKPRRDRDSSKVQRNLRRALTGDENMSLRDHARSQIQKRSHVVKKQVRRVVTGDSNRRLRDWAKEAKVVKTVDKFSFVLGVFCLCATEFMVLQYPQYFGQYYVLLVSIMMALRLYMYARNKWLYFLIDFCYMVNASCFVSVLWLPRNTALWRLNYAVTNGTLLAAILAWRNSLVFHSLDKVTSIAIHLLPALLTYLQRWNHTSPMCPNDDDDDDDDNCSIGIQGALFEPLLFYMFWQFLYIIKTEVMDRKVMLANPNIQTSLRWLTRDAKNPMHVIVKRICRNVGVLQPTEDFDPESLKTKCVFWTGNLVFVVMTLLPIPILFQHHTVNTAYILFVISTAVYNGSNYYFEVFAARYMQKLEDKEKEIRSNGTAVADATEQESNDGSQEVGIDIVTKQE